MKTKLTFLAALASCLLSAPAAEASDCPGDRTKVVLETLFVPSSGATVTTTFVPQACRIYFLKASGTFSYWPASTPHGIADAECASRPANSYGPGWVMGEDVLPPSLSHGLDVLVDGNNVSWGNSCNLTDHTYVLPYSGQGRPVSFSIWDDFYRDNSGGITIELYECR